jgi:ribosomal protein S18 acetylase RimI-like enzyme
LIVRNAAWSDAEAMASLIVALGYSVTSDDIAQRIAMLAEAGEPPIVAETDGIVGCLTWHIMRVLHRPAPVGRITMLVVAEAQRGQGIGKALVLAAEARLAARGCGLVEVTSNMKRGPAHAFYERLGYERTSYRFARALQPG